MDQMTYDHGLHAGVTPAAVVAGGYVLLAPGACGNNPDPGVTADNDIWLATGCLKRVTVKIGAVANQVTLIVYDYRSVTTHAVLRGGTTLQTGRLSMTGGTPLAYKARKKFTHPTLGVQWTDIYHSDQAGAAIGNFPTQLGGYAGTNNAEIVFQAQANEFAAAGNARTFTIPMDVVCNNGILIAVVNQSGVVIPHAATSSAIIVTAEWEPHMYGRARKRMASLPTAAAANY